jgi:hypothetical protein
MLQTSASFEGSIVAIDAAVGDWSFTFRTRCPLGSISVDWHTVEGTIAPLHKPAGKARCTRSD